jgi:glycosyltransferase involved in cell wall biosynthesis
MTRITCASDLRRNTKVVWDNIKNLTKGLADYNGTVVVIPTRNRAPLAVNAIRSVLEQPLQNVQLIVSDNSSIEREKEDLASFCSNLANPRLRYVRPPQSLSMTAHWEWAIQQALSLYAASHFLYLTDRMMFKPAGLKEVLDRASVYPTKVVSYNHDMIADDKRPIRIEQHPYTGKLLEIKTLRLSYLYSQAIFHHGLPRMLNSVTPRSVLDRIQQRYGNVFASVAPDFNFCCRCLELEDSILYYDKAVIFQYALNRSNGASESRGELTPDYVDFIANLPAQGAIRNYATPLPQLATGINAVFHEYLAFKQETNSPRFFDLDFQRYLKVNAEQVQQLVDPGLRAKMQSLLEAHGLEKTNSDPLPVTTPVRSRLYPTAIWNQPRSRLKAALADRWTKGGWLFLARHFGISPPDNNAFEFSEIEEAIDYLTRFPRTPLKDWPWQEDLLEAHQLLFSSQSVQ